MYMFRCVCVSVSVCVCTEHWGLHYLHSLFSLRPFISGLTCRVCLHIRVHTHTHTHMGGYVEAREHCWLHLLLSILFHCGRMSHWAVSWWFLLESLAREHPGPTHLCPLMLVFQWYKEMHMQGFYLDAGDLNVSPPAGKGSLWLNKLSL